MKKAITMGAVLCSLLMALSACANHTSPTQTTTTTTNAAEQTTISEQITAKQSNDEAYYTTLDEMTDDATTEEAETQETTTTIEDTDRYFVGNDEVAYADIKEGENYLVLHPDGAQEKKTKPYTDENADKIPETTFSIG